MLNGRRELGNFTSLSYNKLPESIKLTSVTCDLLTSLGTNVINFKSFVSGLEI